MTQPQRAPLGVIAYMLLCGAVIMPVAARGAAADPRQEIAQTSQKLLADLMDGAATTRLRDLRRLQQKRSAESLNALAAGLEAYAAGETGLAAQKLDVAMRWAETVEMANRILVGSLAELREECKLKLPLARVPVHNACGKCGDTKLAECPGAGCYGSGWTVCDTCRGKGKTRKTEHGRTTERDCPRCRGWGALSCPTCGSKGTVPCPLCGRGAASGAVRQPPAGFGARRGLEAIRKVIDKARYLSQGMPDTDSPDAFRPSPKLRGQAP